MNWYTAMIPGRTGFPSYLDGQGIFVCNNPLRCWQYVPSTVWTELWKVMPTNPVKPGQSDNYGKVDSLFLLRKIEHWELAAYATSEFACVTAGQHLTTGGTQRVHAYGNAIVSAQDSCHVKAWDTAVVNACDTTVVEAWHTATVVLMGQSRCYAHDDSTVTLFGKEAAVTFPKKSNVRVHLIDADPKNVLADGRYFTARAYKEWVKENEKTFSEQEDTFWDTIPPPRRDPEIIRQEQSEQGRASLASLFE